MDFTELLQQAQRLTNETKMDTQTPRVERTFSQFLQATQELHTRVTQTGTKDLQAHILLGSRGVDLPKLTRTLESLSARKSFEPLDHASVTDVQSYLKNERENTILSIINETNNNVFESVEKQKWRCIYADWGEEKQRLLNALVGPTQQDFPSVDCFFVPTVLQENPKPSSRLNHIQTMYVKEITNYNLSSGQNNRANLIVNFKNLSKTFDNIMVHEMWSVLNYVVDVTPLSRSEDPIQDRLNNPHFIKQARIYLENRFKQYMNSIVNENLILAQRGGAPSVYNLICSFVRVTFSQPQSLIGLTDKLNNLPLWPLVYCGIRCGYISASIKFLKEAGICEDLLAVMQLRMGKQPVESQISKLESQLKLEYANNLRNSTDPFKKAVYAIVLACDPNEPHPEAASSIDDFLWMQLSVLRNNVQREYDIEQLTYGGLQSMILEKYGENYFNAREKAPLYFQVLTLTGQFESAIEFLARTETYRCHAVHMAIALNELSMLGAPSSLEKPLLYADPNDPQPMKRLNLARLIIMYAKTFEQTDTKEAIQYYYLLRYFKDNKGRNLLLASVCDLLVESCEDSMLELVFGQPKLETWSCAGGIIAEFPAMDFDKFTLAGMTGDELSKRCKYEMAIKLYYIGGHFDKALKVVSTLLSQVVHQRPCEGHLRERLYKVVQKLNNILSTRNVLADGHTIMAYRVLSELLIFFDYYHSNQFSLASEILAKHKLAPSTAISVNDCAEVLKRAGPDVIKVIPDVLLAAMDMVYQEYMKIKGSGNSDNNTESMLRNSREHAKSITDLAATLPYRMPADINKQLVQIEILMH